MWGCKNVRLFGTNSREREYWRVVLTLFHVYCCEIVTLHLLTTFLIYVCFPFRYNPYFNHFIKSCTHHYTIYLISVRKTLEIWDCTKYLRNDISPILFVNTVLRNYKDFFLFFKIKLVANGRLWVERSPLFEVLQFGK